MESERKYSGIFLYILSELRMRKEKAWLGCNYAILKGKKKAVLKRRLDAK